MFFIFLYVEVAHADKKRESYTIAVSKDFPPLSSTNELGELVGLDVDVAKALCKELDIQCKLKDYPVKEIIPALQSGEVFFAVASIVETDERKKLINFSNQYYKTVNLFFKRKGEQHIITDENIKEIRIGVERGSSEAYILKEKYGKDTEIVEADGIKQLFNDLKTGKVEVIYIISIVGYDYLLQSEAGDFEPVKNFSKEKEEVQRVKIAIPKGQDALTEDINRALDIMMRSGEFQRINRKYFDYLTLFTSKA